MSSLINRLNRVLAEYPDLTTYGRGTFEQWLLTPAEREAKFAVDREHMFEPQCLEQFERAAVWVGQFAKVTKFLPCSSYGLKHLAERDIGYITNGVFIAAAVDAGFTLKWCYGRNPNALFNISRRVLRLYEQM